MSPDVLVERMNHVLARVEDLCDRLEKSDARFDKLAEKVESLERWKSFLLGAWAVTSLLGGGAMFLLEMLHRAGGR